VRRRKGRVRYPFFVYGTLRPGERNHDLFLRGRTESEAPGRLRGALLYEGPGYPYAVEEPGGEGGTVSGELVTALPEAYDELLAVLGALIPGEVLVDSDQPEALTSRSLEVKVRVRYLKFPDETGFEDFSTHLLYVVGLEFQPNSSKTS